MPNFISQLFSSPKQSSALRRALRTAIVAFAGLSIGIWGLQNPNVAVFATFSSFALLGFADFGGPVRSRIFAYISCTLAGVVLAVVGTWASSQSIVVDGLVTFIVAALIVMSGLLGGYFATAATALPLFYLVAVGTPAAFSATPGRVVGVLLGGFMSVLAATLLWPTPVEPGVLGILGKKTRKLSDRLEEITTGKAKTDDTVALPLSEVRTFIDGLASRPASPTSAARATLYVINDLEWLIRLIGHLAQDQVSDSDKPTLQAAVTQLSGVANSLESGQFMPAPSPSTNMLPFGTASRLAITTTRLAEHARVALGATSKCKLQGLDVDLSSPSVFSRGLERLTSNLTFHSVYFQDAMRTGVALAIAVVIARYFHLPHAFWVALATYTIIQRNIQDTGRRVTGAIVGALIGFTLSLGLITLIGSSALGYAILTPILIALSIYSGGALNFVIGQAAFTTTVIVLFNLLAPAGWPVGVQRVEDVLVGCLVALIVGAVAWPQGAIASLRLSSADLITSATAYLIQTLERFLPDTPPQEHASKTQVTQSAQNAEDSFALYLREKPGTDQVDSWSQLLAAANRLWYAADLISSYDFTAKDYPGPQELESILWRLEHNNAEAAADIKSGKTIHVDRAQMMGIIESNTMITWLAQIASEFKVSST